MEGDLDNMAKKTATAVDLFAGCGGMSLGFQSAGFDVLCAFELWEPAALCYELNFSHPVHRMDLSDTAEAVCRIKPLNPDLIIGGPPCQDYSHAGKRVESGQASLTRSFFQIVKEVNPAYFVMENVDRAAKSRTYSLAKGILKGSGYGLTEATLDASRCGVPQRRKRFFSIGSLSDKDNFLLEGLLSNVDVEEMTLRRYFKGELGLEHYYRHPRNYSRRAVYSIDEPAATIRGVNRPIPQGYPGHPGDACAIDGTLRPLTTLERARVQTFPKSFKWAGPKTTVEQLIGNAVPVKLAEYVAKRLLAHMAGKRGKMAG
jgi:DNA (cytosine-5)-methyltransferase 1